MFPLHLGMSLLRAAERGSLPDFAVRTGIRQLLRARLKALESKTVEEGDEDLTEFIERCRHSPVACVPEKANEQHYEVPQEFFELVLGTHRKYSCCYWDADTSSLERAEQRALSQTCLHADLYDGQTILELGCGWGSLSLWMASEYPSSSIVAISNSHSQRQFIERAAATRGIRNLNVITEDINTFEPTQSFDRVVSVEMFEHVRNHAELFRRISRWLTDDGKLFVHIFCNRQFSYLFEDRSNVDWMARHFFSGGMMPSRELFMRYQEHMSLEQTWTWDGRHYQRTSDAWLENFDRKTNEISAILRKAYGRDWNIWFHRWRMFFMACSELFGHRNGREWFVTHYLFRRAAGERNL